MGADTKRQTRLAAALVIAVVAVWVSYLLAWSSQEARLARVYTEEYIEMSQEKSEVRDYRHAKALIDLLALSLNPKNEIPLHNPILRRRVESARGLATSNIVAQLKTLAGEDHGTNIQAWLAWVSARKLSPDP